MRKKEGDEDGGLICFRKEFVYKGYFILEAHLVPGIMVPGG